MLYDEFLFLLPYVGEIKIIISLADFLAFVGRSSRPVLIPFLLGQLVWDICFAIQKIIAASFMPGMTFIAHPAGRLATTINHQTQQIFCINEVLRQDTLL